MSVRDIISYLLPGLIYAQNNADDKYEIMSLTDMLNLFKDSIKPGNKYMKSDIILFFIIDQLYVRYLIHFALAK